MDTDTIQIAIRYASKMRKMQLANRLGELACLILDKEEEEAKAAAAAANECESQKDMFGTQGDDDVDMEGGAEEEEEETNPFLAAKLKKEAKLRRSGPSILKESQSESRNPFKKSLNTSRYEKVSALFFMLYIMGCCWFSSIAVAPSARVLCLMTCHR